MAGWRLLLLSSSVAALTGGICVALGKQGKASSTRGSTGESWISGAASSVGRSVHGVPNSEQEGRRATAEDRIEQLAEFTAAASTGQGQPLRQSPHHNGIAGSTAGPPNMGSTALDTVLLITVIVSVLVCFLLGIFVAFLCFRSMRASAKDGSSSSFPFSQPNKQGQAAQEYHTDEQAQLFNYQSRMAQMHANLKTNRGMTPYASGDEMILVTSNQESVAAVNVNSDVILGADGPAQVSSARIVNPVFDSERHGTLSRQASAQSQPANSPATRKPQSASNSPATRKPQSAASARRASSMHKKPAAKPKAATAAVKRSTSTPEPGSSTSSAEKTASHGTTSTSSSVLLASCSSHGGSSSTPSSATPGASAATAAGAEPGGQQEQRSTFRFSPTAAAAADTEVPVTAAAMIAEADVGADDDRETRPSDEK